MTKLYLFVRRYLTVLLVFGTLVSFAQQTVSGKATGADDGSGVPVLTFWRKAQPTVRCLIQMEITG
ncbi:MAG: hypothetical protein U5K54_23945 [Cytophagales bacterium]|nr:hypothetical protein [Cytophagales bacterium]